MVGSCFIWELSPIHTGSARAVKTTGGFRLFLYFSVLTFTLGTSLNNALVKVSKSRTGDFHRLMGTVSTKPVVLNLSVTHVEAHS